MDIILETILIPYYKFSLNRLKINLNYMNKHWYLVGERAGARIFEQEGVKSELRLIKNFENHQGALKTSELVSDRQGRTESSSANGHHAVGKEDTARQHVLERFSKELGKFLEHEAQQKSFSSIVLVAEPQMLGELRKSIGKVTSKLVRDGISKDFIRVSDHDMAVHLKDSMLVSEEISQ